MSLGAGIFTFLSDGMSVGERVYPLTLPQDVELPAVTYRVVSETPVTTHSTAQDAPTHSDVRYEQTRVQFDLYGRDYDEAEALRTELLDLAEGYRGMWGDEVVDMVLRDVSVDDWDPAPGVWRQIQDLIIGHKNVPAS